jgi:hypothetical protein
LSRSLLAGGYSFSVAGRADDSQIRALLQENEIGGWIRLTVEREPDAFAAATLFDRHEFLLARESSGGRAIALCEYAVRRLYLAGSPRLVPYLGALRVDSRFRRRIAVLRHGFAAVRGLLYDPRDYPHCLTAITEGNSVAERVLCAGIAGLPRYQPIGEMVTFACPTRRSSLDPGIALATRAELPAIADLLQRLNRKFDFAPHWGEADLAMLAPLGLPAGHFLVARQNERIVGSAGVWDQRRLKQAVVRGYSPWVQRVRPLYNAFAPILGMPRLPPLHTALNQVFISHLAVEDDDPELTYSLIRAALSLAKNLGADIALVGLNAQHPVMPALRSVRHREYRMRLYLVRWPDTPDPEVPGGIVQPEIALL